MATRLHVMEVFGSSLRSETATLTVTFVDIGKGYVDRGTCPSFSLCHSASYFPAYDAQPYARVPQCALHLRVCIPPAFPLHALGKVNPSLPGTWVSGLYYWVFLSSGILSSKNDQGLSGPFQYDCSGLPYSETKVLLNVVSRLEETTSCM